jgi:hypothetical protein
MSIRLKLVGQLDRRYDNGVKRPYYEEYDRHYGAKRIATAQGGVNINFTR